MTAATTYNQITGSPTAYKVGRRVLFVSYVSLGEWQTFGELVKLDEKRAVEKLVFWALRRATPTITCRFARRLVRRYDIWVGWLYVCLILHFFSRRLERCLIKWCAKRSEKCSKPMIGLIELLCKLSMPDIPQASTPVAIAKEAECSMKTTFRQLSRMHGWTPAEISGMSPAQFSAYASGGEDGTGTMKLDYGSSEYNSFCAQRKKA